MTIRIGINGFGRIGRALFRILLENNCIDGVIINDINPDKNNIAYQLKYDSLYGILDHRITSTDYGMKIGDCRSS